jgi:hypothetical protein
MLKPFIRQGGSFNPNPCPDNSLLFFYSKLAESQLRYEFIGIFGNLVIWLAIKTEKIPVIFPASRESC